MVREHVRAYWGMASGLTELTRQRAMDAARALVAQGEATAGQTKAIADELLATGKSNRDAVVQLVRYEVDRALGRLGLASAEEIASLQSRLRSVESQLREVTEDRAATAPAPQAAAAPRSAAGKPAAAEKTGTKKTAAAKTAAVKTGARSGAKKSGTKKSGTQKSGATKSGTQRSGR